ncbi:MAG TPA: hypothetical protein VE869_08035 [Gemmatimonas sp.]|nr:hypothetical protein [Gemmatimonas sp.]
MHTLRVTALSAMLGTVSILAVSPLAAQSAGPPVPPSSGQSVMPSAPDTVLGTAAFEQFVGAHIAVSVFRDRVHAELADPRNKRPELLLALREKLRTGTQRILQEHKLTEAAFHQLTRRVSSDDAMRTAFDSAVTRLSVVKRGG